MTGLVARTAAWRGWLGAVLAAWAVGATAATIDSVGVTTHTGQPYSADVIRANIRSLAGQTFNPETLSEDIQRLYKTGLFSDVEARVDPMEGERVAITFIVQPQGRIRSVVFTGNSYVKTRALLKKVTVTDGSPLDRAKIAEDARAIRRLYEDKGYYGTEVTAEEQPVAGEGNEYQLVWRIVEEPRHKVRAVEFVGNSAYTERELRRKVVSKRTWLGYLISMGYVNEDKVEADQLILQRMYGEKGYLDFQVEQVERQLSRGDRWVTLVYHLSEGQPYAVRNVTVSGNQLFGQDELAAALRAVPGNPYNTRVEQQDIEAIEARYYPMGYLEMRCRAALNQDAATHEVDVDYQIVEGQASRIRDITISGNVVTRDEVIRRELRIQPGDLSDANQIEASKKVLENLNYFETVSITPRSTPQDDLRDLEVNVTEKRTGQLLLGAGFSSDDSLVGTFEVTQANFDWRNWPRFTGDGQRMRLRLDLGTERTNVLVSFVEPWWFDRRLRLELNAFLSTRSESEYDQTNTGGSIEISRQVWNVWRQSFGLTLEHIELDDFDDDVSAELLAEEGSYWSTGLSFGMTRDTRDRYLNPTRGSRVQLRSEIMPEALGTYSNLYRLDARATKFFPLPGSTVLRLRGEIGVVDELSGDRPAIFDRYFAGGATSFRGFSRREISPKDINEDPLGGQSILLGSVELIFPLHPLPEQFLGAVFCDVGNVWADPYDWDPSDVNVSVGAGLLLNLPIGPIRLEYGFPIHVTDDTIDDSGEFHFNLGYYF